MSRTVSYHGCCITFLLERSAARSTINKRVLKHPSKGCNSFPSQTPPNDAGSSVEAFVTDSKHSASASAAISDPARFGGISVDILYTVGMIDVLRDSVKHFQIASAMESFPIPKQVPLPRVGRDGGVAVYMVDRD